MNQINENLHWILVALLIFIIVWIVAFVVRTNKAKTDQNLGSDNQANERGPAPPRRSSKN